jgi:hypothetical protein
MWPDMRITILDYRRLVTRMRIRRAAVIMVWISAQLNFSDIFEYLPYTLSLYAE